MVLLKSLFAEQKDFSEVLVEHHDLLTGQPLVAIIKMGKL
jgi:hypothetical protein